MFYKFDKFPFKIVIRFWFTMAWLWKNVKRSSQSVILQSRSQSSAWSFHYSCVRGAPPLTLSPHQMDELLACSLSCVSPCQMCSCRSKEPPEPEGRRPYYWVFNQWVWLQKQQLFEWINTSRSTRVCLKWWRTIIGLWRTIGLILWDQMWS